MNGHCGTGCRVVGNRPAIEGGALTRGLFVLISDSSVKKSVPIEEAEQVGEGVVTLATGDGANDSPMLESATYGIAYRARPGARAAANGRIDRGDLTCLLKLSGIPEHDWVQD